MSDRPHLRFLEVMIGSSMYAHHVGQLLYSVYGFWSSQYEHTKIWEVAVQEWYVSAVSHETQHFILHPARSGHPVAGGSPVFTKLGTGVHYYTDKALALSEADRIKSNPPVKN